MSPITPHPTDAPQAPKRLIYDRLRSQTRQKRRTGYHCIKRKMSKAEAERAYLAMSKEEIAALSYSTIDRVAFSSRRSMCFKCWKPTPWAQCKKVVKGSMRAITTKGVLKLCCRPCQPFIAPEEQRRSEMQVCDMCRGIGELYLPHETYGAAVICRGCWKSVESLQELQEYQRGKPRLDLVPGRRTLCIVLSRSSWDPEDQKTEIIQRESQSHQLAQRDIPQFLPEGVSLDEVVAIHLPGMAASMIPRLQRSPTDQGLLVDQFNRLVDALNKIPHGTNLLILRQGAEASSVNASWYANLLSILAPKNVATIMAYAHQVHAIEDCGRGSDEERAILCYIADARAYLQLPHSFYLVHALLSRKIRMGCWRRRRRLHPGVPQALPRGQALYIIQALFERPRGESSVKGKKQGSSQATPAAEEQDLGGIPTLEVLTILVTTTKAHMK